MMRPARTSMTCRQGGGSVSQPRAQPAPSCTRTAETRAGLPGISAPCPPPRGSLSGGIRVDDVYWEFSVIDRSGLQGNLFYTTPPRTLSAKLTHARVPGSYRPPLPPPHNRWRAADDRYPPRLEPPTPTTAPRLRIAGVGVRMSVVGL